MNEQIAKARHPDPFDDERWPFSLAAAWIIWRSRDRVTQLLSDIAGSEGRVQVFDVFNDAMRRESVPDVPPEGGVLAWREAQVDLWEQLKQGRLVAMGVRVGEGTWSRIPASEWPGLDYFSCDNGRSDAIGSNLSAIYRGVTVLRSAVLELWPTIDKTQIGLVKTTSRGRKRMIGQDQIDKVVFELFEDNGDLSGDDPDWNIQAHVERSTRTVLEKKFGEKNVVKESTLRPYVKNAIEKREKRKGR